MHRLSLPYSFEPLLYNTTAPYWPPLMTYWLPFTKTSGLPGDDNSYKDLPKTSGRSHKWQLSGPLQARLARLNC